MATSIINKVQPCGLEHIKKLLSASGVSDALSIQATALTIYGKFDTTLLEINFKFVFQSLSSILDVLV